MNLATGGEKIQDALYAFQELSERFHATVPLLNAQATALLLQNKFEEAEVGFCACH